MLVHNVHYTGSTSLNNYFEPTRKLIVRGNMMKKGLVAISILVALLAIGSQASADPIGPDCGTCQGSIYTLTYDGTALADADPLKETFRITLTIDTTGYSGGGGFIDAAAIKVSSSSVSASLFDAPVGVGN